MPKILFLIRHAKTEAASFHMADFDRRLTESGRKDAADMAKKVLVQGWKPTLMISSTAVRAIETSEIFSEVWNYPKQEIQKLEELYHCTIPAFEKTLEIIPDTVQIVSITAHNPGITGYLNSLSEKFNIDNMPTGSVAGIRADTEEWSKFGNATKEVFLFEYPLKNP
jgi:phosphohistidine phosphatase